MSKDTTVIEVNGIKLEVDLRTAKRIEELRVGDKVKVLVKDYSDNYNVHPGVVVGFEPFNALPTIIVAYAIIGYASFELKFLHFNAKTKEGCELIKALDEDIEISQADVMKTFERQIAEHERQISDLKEKRDYFVRQFRAYWVNVAQSAPAEAAE